MIDRLTGVRFQMAMDVVMLVVLHGELPQEKLEALREQLGLQQEGRLTDAEDSLFGYRYLRDDPGSSVLVQLYRSRDDEWAVDLSAEGTRPPQEVIDGWRAAIEEAASRLGLSVSRTWPA